MLSLDEAEETGRAESEGAAGVFGVFVLRGIWALKKHDIYKHWVSHQ